MTTTFKYKSNENIFKKAYKELNSKSDEAWFGVNNPLRLELIAIFTKMFTKYKAVFENKPSDKTKFVQNIMSEVHSIELLLIRELNVEKCQIGVFDDIDMFCFPSCWDENVTGSVKTSKDFRKSLMDIVETKHGFRYKDPTGKFLLIGLGLRFFDPAQKYTPEELAAVLLHEIGHSFQHMLTGINANIAYVLMQRKLVESYNGLKLSNLLNNLGLSIITLNVFGVIYSLFQPIIALFTFFPNLIKAKTLVNSDEKAERVGDKLTKKTSTLNNKGYPTDRKELAKDLTRDDEHNINKSTKDKSTRIGFFNALAIVICGIFSPVLYIIDIPANLYLWTNLKFFKKNRRYEEFADAFAVYYGLGEDLASGLLKIGNNYHKSDLNIISFINYVPILNIVINTWYYHELNIKLLTAGYPIDKVRIANVYKTLDYELKNNKELSLKDREVMAEQMKNTEEVYNEFVYGKGAKNFIYKLYNKTIHASITKEIDKSSDIEENVLQVMNDKKLIDEIKKEEQAS